MHKIWFDCETGGTDPKRHSLLTAFFAILDKDDKIIDELYLQLKPEKLEDIRVTQEALDICNINITDHLNDPDTITYAEGCKKLEAMLEKNKIPKKRKHYQPAGHNIDFDIGFISEQLISKESWEKTVHYRKIDTSNICTFLKDVEMLPEDVGSLTSLVEYFEIPMGEAHNARGDILMNIEVYKSMKQIFKNVKKEAAQSSTNSLLDIIEE